MFAVAALLRAVGRTTNVTTVSSVQALSVSSVQVLHAEPGTTARTVSEEKAVKNEPPNITQCTANALAVKAAEENLLLPPPPEVQYWLDGGSMYVS